MDLYHIVDDRVFAIDLKGRVIGYTQLYGTRASDASLRFGIGIKAGGRGSVADGRNARSRAKPQTRTASPATARLDHDAAREGEY